MSTEEMQDLPTKVKPIKCPRCGSTELAFVTEYHKELLLRIFNTISALVTVGFLISLFVQLIIAPKRITEMTYIPLIIAAVVTVILWIAILVSESETHVQAICKNCGNIWLLN